MTEADILATTYEDTVTVYRAFKDTLPGGESVFKSGLDGKVVYEDVECALVYTYRWKAAAIEIYCEDGNNFLSVYPSGS